MLWRVVFALLMGYAASSAAFGAEDRVAVAVARNEDGFVVTAEIDAQVARQTAWDVMVDYDHMSSIVHNLTVSKVTSRDGNTLMLKQEGAVKYGLFTLPFQSEREIRLEPTALIAVRQISGSLKSMVSETRLSAAKAEGSHDAHGIHISYRAEIVPDSFFARLFGGNFVRDGVEEQFRLLVAEMKRREAKPASGDGARSVDGSR